MFVHRRKMRGAMAQLFGGGCKARIDQDQCAPIGLIGAAVGLVRRGIGKFAQFVADFHQPVGQAQARPQQMGLVQVMLECQR